MTDDNWEEAVDTEHAKIQVRRHIYEAGGSHTAQDISDSGIVTNADDAVALMSRRVDAGDATKTVKDGLQAIKAVA